MINSSLQPRTFDGCADYPEIDYDEIRGFLDTAEGRTTGYYQGIFVKSLQSHFIAK